MPRHRLVLLLALLAALTAGFTDSLEGNTAEGEKPPPLEVVIAKFKEDVAWVDDVPREWAVTIYDKGPSNTPLPKLRRPFRHMRLYNTQFGREGETFLYHIVLRFASLANYTVFAQADPFVHAPHLMQLLQNPEALAPVQPLSMKYIVDPIPAVTNGCLFRAERMSLRTLNSLYFHDGGTVTFYEGYLSNEYMERGGNIMHHWFSSIGLADWIPIESETGSFAVGAIFGVRRENILQHPQSVYAAALRKCHRGFYSSYVLERSWLMWFNASFADPRTSPPNF